MDEFRLAFATAVIEANPVKFFGGILVVDPSSDPLEFRCTSPVQPLPIQQILWGQRLKRYILTELLLIPLVNALESRPDLVLTQDPDFLGAREGMSVPLLCVSESSVETPAHDDEHAIVFSDPLNPSRWICLNSANGYVEDLDSGRRLVETFARACFPLEPFRRVEEALKALKSKLESRIAATGK
jgi:hypothetical protein